MLWQSTNYNPDDTETFRKHFGSPQVDPSPGPWRLFWRDIKTLFQKAYLLPDIASPWIARNKEDELYLGPPDGAGIIWLLIWSLVQAPFLIFLFVTSVVSIAIIRFFCQIYTLLFWRVIQGPQFQVYPDNLPDRYNPRQRWIFINGIAVGKTTMRQELTVLSETFNAPILGINNRTYGFLGDLIECLLQRDIDFQTAVTLIAEPIIKNYLEDTQNVDKVVIVAHSQGGIIVSDILKVMFSEVDWNKIHHRLEVYTFASAAMNFPNPWFDSSHSEKLITHMEHYCNQLDFVTQFGALASVHRKNDKYQGLVFEAMGRKGHLLNQDYLSYMFKSPHCAFLRHLAVRDKNPQMHNLYHVQDEDAESEGKSVEDLSYLWTYMERP